MIASNVRVNYEDYTFPTKLERKIENINAIVTANKEKLVETADIDIKDKNIELKTLFKDESNDKSASLQEKLRIDKFLLAGMFRRVRVQAQRDYECTPIFRGIYYR